MKMADVIGMLIGPIEPQGNQSTDRERLAHIIEYGEAVIGMVQELNGILKYRDRPEESIKQIVEKAEFYLDEIGEMMAGEKQGSDYRDCFDPECNGGTNFSITCDKCGEGMLCEPDDIRKI